MPWWGWLIAGCVGFLGLLWTIVSVYAIRSVKRLASDDDRDKLRTSVQARARTSRRWVGGRWVEMKYSGDRDDS